jgi:hypothetical protein
MWGLGGRGEGRFLNVCFMIGQSKWPNAIIKKKLETFVLWDAS